MQIEKVKCESQFAPDDFVVRKLGKNFYELEANQNIVQFEGERDEIKQTLYSYDKSRSQVRIKSRNDGISALIRLCYSQDDEFALVNKGIVDKEDSSFIKYRSYVENCKAQASVYFNAL